MVRGLKMDRWTAVGSGDRPVDEVDNRWGKNLLPNVKIEGKTLLWGSTTDDCIKWCCFVCTIHQKGKRCTHKPWTKPQLSSLAQFSPESTNVCTQLHIIAISATFSMCSFPLKWNGPNGHLMPSAQQVVFFNIGEYIPERIIILNLVWIHSKFPFR